LEHEALICPFCGAPYREVIPSGTVQVKCKYCGGTILVPTQLGGETRRCPNHQDVLAIGLCNDCGESYCDSCLSFYHVEHGTLHLCPNCFKERETEKVQWALIMGVLVLLAGFFFISFAPSSEDAVVSGVFFIGVFALPFLAWGIYRTTHLPQALTIKDRNEEIKKETEFRKAFGSEAAGHELYARLANESIRNYGPMLGYEILERRIGYYMLSGMTRSEAVRKLAEEYSYLFTEQ